MSDKADKEKGDILRQFFKRWPRFYYAVAHIFGPIWFTGLSPKDFLSQYGINGVVVNIGSGPRRIKDGVVNIDAHAYAEVDVVGDITALPLEANSVQGIICDNVLEHVSDPKKAMEEIHRVLAPKGVAYISTPFLYAFHSSPSDFYRWTHEGYAQLCKDFAIREVGVRGGTFSSLVVLLAHAFARVFSCGSLSVYWVYVNIFIILFSPLKLLDVVLNLFPFGEFSASVYYVVIEKS